MPPLFLLLLLFELSNESFLVDCFDFDLLVISLLLLFNSILLFSSKEGIFEFFIKAADVLIKFEFELVCLILLLSMAPLLFLFELLFLN